MSKSVFELKGFVEKPSRKRAERFLKHGRYFWHAGIFLASAANIIASLIISAPRVGRPLSRLVVRKSKIAPARIFRALPHISFDYAVLEKLSRGKIVFCGFDWCDIGTWQSCGYLWPSDRYRNSYLGRHFAVNAHRNIVYAQGKTVCLHGVDDLAVIDTPDVLLVGRKDSAEEMRQLVRQFSKERK